ncbi:ArsI/CadI family heavy metal resistance metalloenzyme [Polyangium sp. y55x31]|uniref:ArsI/CadI family heavy metal resistance metalloenzyme n=1 Tax=Polyangium sp. y55x31 TaxID=3042688 RepID=UPI0024823909|nr:ArsI/CadI family heavy metal resistance metalloenzyme [Polyangium sp. y55x31]MDI1477598.1 ArsI/CadI family heavy metal resistance metalloenzyme [Polyangium sp. y55x31]
MNVLKPHVSLNVTNIEQSVAFYEKAFGVAATKRRPGYAKFDLEVPSLNLTMQEAPRTGVNASHFGVQVATTDDVLEAKARFEAAGLRTMTEEDTSCCYAVQDKVWIEDPDGNSWEVFVVKADAATMGDSPALKKDASECCTPIALSKKPEATPSASSCCGPKTTA